MIINYPTGFYKSILPPLSNTSDKVVTIVSNNQPPRGTLFFNKISLKLASSSSPLISSEPNNEQINGILKSFRNTSVASIPIRPIGSVIEFTDSYADSTNIDASSDLIQNDYFSRFGDDLINPINNKLIKAYRKFQNLLITTTQELQNLYVSMTNYERESNAAIASLDAVNQALTLEPDDQDLLDVRNDLQQKIDSNNSNIIDINSKIDILLDKKSKYQDSIRELVKVIQ